MSAAAALNAERSASRLKKALLAVRKEPLLNDKAAKGPSALNSFTSPSKADKPTHTMLKGFETLRGPLFSESAPKLPDESALMDLKNWDAGEDHFDPSGSGWSAAGGGGRRGKKSHHHGGAHGQPFRRSTGPDEEGQEVPHTSPGQPTFAPSSIPKAPVSFDWGPLPDFGGPTQLAKQSPEPSKPPPAGFISFSNLKSSPSPTPSAPSAMGNGTQIPQLPTRSPGSTFSPGFFGSPSPPSTGSTAPPKGFPPLTQSSLMTTPSSVAAMPKGFFSFANTSTK